MLLIVLFCVVLRCFALCLVRDAANQHPHPSSSLSPSLSLACDLLPMVAAMLRCEANQLSFDDCTASAYAASLGGASDNRGSSSWGAAYASDDYWTAGLGSRSVTRTSSRLSGGGGTHPHTPQQRRRFEYTGSKVGLGEYCGDAVCEALVQFGSVGGRGL